MVADEEEPVSPVRIRGCPTLSHISLPANYNTDNASFNRLAHLMGMNEHKHQARQTKFSEETHYDQLSTCHRRRLQDLLSRSRPENCPYHSLVARLSNVVAYVPKPHSGPGRPLPCDRARFAGIRLLGCARPQAVPLHV